MLTLNGLPKCDAHLLFPRQAPSPPGGHFRETKKPSKPTGGVSLFLMGEGALGLWEALTCIFRSFSM